MSQKEQSDILWMDEVNIFDKNIVGGKNASLGEMYSNLVSKGIKIPYGFMITSTAYKKFITINDLQNKISEQLNKIDYDDPVSLKRVGMNIRTEIQNGDFPEDLNKSIAKYYEDLSKKYTDNNGDPQLYTDVAVRSSDCRRYARCIICWPTRNIFKCKRKTKGSRINQKLFCIPLH